MLLVYFIFSHACSVFVTCWKITEQRDFYFVWVKSSCLEDELGKLSVKESLFHVNTSINFFCCLTVSHQWDFMYHYNWHTKAYRKMKMEFEYFTQLKKFNLWQLLIRWNHRFCFSSVNPHVLLTNVLKYYEFLQKELTKISFLLSSWELPSPGTCEVWFFFYSHRLSRYSISSLLFMPFFCILWPS